MKERKEHCEVCNPNTGHCCTRPRWHRGNHVTELSDGTQVDEWSQDPPPSVSLTTEKSRIKDWLKSEIDNAKELEVGFLNLVGGYPHVVIRIPRPQGFKIKE